MLVRIESAKGKKDRYVPLPASILDDLRSYYRAYHPVDYIFEGQGGEGNTAFAAYRLFLN